LRKETEHQDVKKLETTEEMLPSEVSFREEKTCKTKSKGGT